MKYIPIIRFSKEKSAAIREAFIDNMDREYSLIYTDYRDNYDDSGELIQKCLNTKSNKALFDNHWESESRRTGSEYTFKYLQDKILSDSKYKHLHSDIEDWLKDNKDEIIDIIEDRDTSDPYKEILEQSKNQIPFASFSLNCK